MLFDSYVMMDWSGGNGRRAGKADCIWIAHGPATAAAPTAVSPGSRTEAEDLLRGLLLPFAQSGAGRVLVCADFAYGYPAGFASLIAGTSGRSAPPWRLVWQHLASLLRDDLGTKPGRRPTNESNRFDVANAINAAGGSVPGPFWCLFSPGSQASVPQGRPPQPFRTPSGPMDPLRITDLRASSDTPFRLFGTGSVGSQVITGIPRLEKLRFDPDLAASSAVWPFETGWAPEGGECVRAPAG